MVSDTGRGWRDEREMSCLGSGPTIPSSLENSFTQHYTSHISFSLTINNHRLRDTHIGVLISSPGSCYPEYFLTAVSLSHFPSSGSGVSESLRATEDHKRVECTVPCTVLYCAPLYRQQQGRAGLSLQCCHRWTNVDIRSLFVRKYTL